MRPEIARRRAVATAGGEEGAGEPRAVPGWESAGHATPARIRSIRGRPAHRDKRTEPAPPNDRCDDDSSSWRSPTMRNGSALAERLFCVVYDHQKSTNSIIKMSLAIATAK